MMKDVDTKRKIVVVSGACKKGADNFAASAAKSFHVELLEFPVPKVTYVSRWEYAKAAYARNLTIAENSDVGFALVHDDRTGGTENTISHYNDLKKHVFLVDRHGKFYLKSLDKENEVFPLLMLV